MPTRNLALLLGLVLAPAYATIAFAQASVALCSCGKAHTGPCPAAVSASASPGVHAVRINELGNGSWLPEGHYIGDGHNHTLPVGTSTVETAPFQLNNRWTLTATDGFVGSTQGTPVTLTWGIVPDGTSISNFGGVTDQSGLVAFFDSTIGVAADAGVTDIQSKSWFSTVESAYTRWGEISGLQFAFEPNDDGASLPGSSGSLGVRADMRLAGASIDGQSGANILAFNAFPNFGDGVVDTDNTTFFSQSFNNFVALRNVLAHEIGHGIGFNHVESSDADFLLEPTINLGFDGPQLDDILGVQRNYGDALEANGGNDDFNSATPIGSFGVGDSWAIGTDADSTFVAPTETDFISIDGSEDSDFFTFTVDEESVLDAVLTNAGDVYNEGPEDGTQSVFDARALASLELEIFAVGPGSTSTSLGVSGDQVLFSESVDSLTLQPGVEYAAVVSQQAGSDDNVQLYRLDLTFSAVAVAVPEPGTMLLMLAALGVTASARRRAAFGG